MSSAPAASQAIALLQLLAQRPSPMPATAIARELGIPRSTTYRLLSVLKEAGFVSHSAEYRRWGLGIAAYELGSAYSRQQPMQRMARSVMARLVERTRQAAHLGVLHGSDVLYVIEERPAGVPPLVTDVGVRLPANVTASGMALLALLPAAQVRALFPSGAALVQRNLTAGQPSTLAGFRSELVQVRQRGYAREVGRVTPGFSSVACAAIDHNGLPAAALTVTWRHADDEVGDNREADYATAVCAAAKELTARLAG